MGVSKNTGTPKSSILIGFSIINHPFWGTTIFGDTHIVPNPTTSKPILSDKLPLPPSWAQAPWPSSLDQCTWQRRRKPKTNGVTWAITRWHSWFPTRKAPQCTAHLKTSWMEMGFLLVVEPIHFEKYAQVKLDHLPKVWGEHKKHLKPPVNKSISLWPPSFVGSNHFRPQHPLNLRCEPTSLDLLGIFFNKSPRENRWMFV